MKFPCESLLVIVFPVGHEEGSSSVLLRTYCHELNPLPPLSVNLKSTSWLFFHSLLTGSATNSGAITSSVTVKLLPNLSENWLLEFLTVRYNVYLH